MINAENQNEKKDNYKFVWEIAKIYLICILQGKKNNEL